MSNPDDALPATDAFRCVACSGHGAWHAARQAVVCTFCGAEVALPPARTDRVEHLDLMPLLRDRADSGRTWQPVATSIRCSACNAVTLVRAGMATGVCEACGSTSLVLLDQAGAPISPAGVLPFRLSEAQAREAVRAWITEQVKLDFGRPRVTVEAIRAVYLPCWDFFAHVHCPWRLELTRTDRDGNAERIVRSGTVEQDFALAHPAVRSVSPALLAKIEPFDLAAAVPLDARYVAGAAVEHYTVNLWDAWDEVSARMRARLDEALRDDARTWVTMPDETWPAWSRESGRLLLVPVFVCSCRGRGRVWEVLVNGSTGQVAGDWPTSTAAKVLGVAMLMGIAATAGAVIWWVWSMLKAAGFRPLW